MQISQNATPTDTLQMNFPTLSYSLVHQTKYSFMWLLSFNHPLKCSETAERGQEKARSHSWRTKEMRVMLLPVLLKKLGVCLWPRVTPRDHASPGHSHPLCIIPHFPFLPAWSLPFLPGIRIITKRVSPFSISIYHNISNIFYRAIVLSNWTVEYLFLESHFGYNNFNTQ